MQKRQDPRQPRPNLKKDGTNPLLLYGYGSCGTSMDAEFDPYSISLMDRGFVFAIAHIRGGQELGRPWYEDGKLLKKKNTFTDFIACAEHLVAEKYTCPDRLFIWGASCRPDFAIGVYSGYLKAKDKDEVAVGLRIPAGAARLCDGRPRLRRPPERLSMLDVDAGVCRVAAASGIPQTARANAMSQSIPPSQAKFAEGGY